MVERRTWLDENNEEIAPMYILDEKVRSAKRHTSSHGTSQLIGTLHVIFPQLDTSVIDEYCAGNRGQAGAIE